MDNKQLQEKSGQNFSKGLHHCHFPGCKKSFKRRDYLARHTSNHSLQKPFHCDICDVSFNRKDLAEKHKKSRKHCLFFAKSKSQQIFINSFVQQPVVKTSSKLQCPHIDIEEVITNPSLDTHVNNDRFSNVSNSIEDSFGWLFGTGSPFGLSDDLYDIDDYYSEQSPFVDNKEFEVEILDHGMSPFTLSSLIQYTKSLNVGEIPVEEILTKSSIDLYLSRYWVNLNSIYPIIHRSTFNANPTENDPQEEHYIFLLALITIEIFYSHEGSDELHQDEYKLAIRVQKSLRLQIYRLIDDVTVPSLRLLQCLLLNDIFAMYFGDRTQHTNFTIYHPIVLNILKRLNVFVNLQEPYIDLSEDGNNFNYLTWKKWIEYESFKRISFFAYILDTQAAFFFGNTPAISVFDIQLELPYTDSVWSARDPPSFIEAYKHLPREFVDRAEINMFDQPNRYDTNELEGEIRNNNLIPNIKSEGKWPNFLWSLRRLMQPFSKDHQEYHFDCFSQFSRYVFLHGVVSLLKELRNSNIVEVKILPATTVNAVAAKIEQSFLNWKIYFHKNIAELNATYRSEKNTGDNYEKQVINVYDTSPMFWSNLTLLNAGLLGLYCDFDLITQYSTITTNVLEPSDSLISYERSQYESFGLTKNTILVNSWAKSKDGEYSMLQSCLLLRTILSNESLLIKVPHLAYTMYISTLVCWAFIKSTLGLNWRSLTIFAGLTSSQSKEKTLEFLVRLLKDDHVQILSSTEDDMVYLRASLASLLQYVVYAYGRFPEWGNVKYLSDKIEMLFH